MQVIVVMFEAKNDPKILNAFKQIGIINVLKRLTVKDKLRKKYQMLLQLLRWTLVILRTFTIRTIAFNRQYVPTPLMSYVKILLVDRFMGIPIQEDTTVLDVIETILEKNDVALGYAQICALMCNKNNKLMLLKPEDHLFEYEK